MKINFIESNPIPVKAALAMMGKISEVYRSPLVKMGDDARANKSKPRNARNTRKLFGGCYPVSL